MTTAERIVRICSRLGLIGEAAALIRNGNSVEDAHRLVSRERQFRRIQRRQRWSEPYWRGLRLASKRWFSAPTASAADLWWASL